MNHNDTIFLAYAREDERYVKRLYNILEENGLEPWMDQKNLNPGEDWLKKADEAIKSARFFLACFSNQSKDKSGYFQRELNVALGELEKKAPDELYFIPLLIEDVELPNIRSGTMYLRDIHAIAVFEEEGIEKLVHFLKREIHTDALDVKDHRPVRETEETEYQKLTAQLKGVIAQVKGITPTDKAPEKKEDPIQKIKQRTAEGKIDIALELLKDYVKEHCPEWDNDVIQLSARYHGLQAEYTKDIISQEQYQRQKNKITNAFLETVQRLKIQTVASTDISEFISSKGLPRPTEIKEKTEENLHMDQVKRVVFYITIEADFNKDNDVEIGKIIDRLITFTKDDTIKINAIKESSIKIYIEAKEETLLKLINIFKEGSLSEIIGYEVKELDLDIKIEADKKSKYDIGLSFAEEDRAYVEKVALHLKNMEVKVFYDEFDDIKMAMWGKNSYQYLDTIYKSCRYVIIFISHAYAKKHRTMHELGSVQARAFKENREYILPVRFDNSELPGLNETTAFLDAKMGPEKIAELAYHKLNST